MGEVADPDAPESVGGHASGGIHRQDWVNRKYIVEEEQFPQVQTFESGMSFIRKNQKEDRWFLQLETFDPHEPFYAPTKYRDMYPHEYAGMHFDWPPYSKVDQTEDEVAHVRYEYAALLSMCDAYLGKVLDLMDELDLWKDTLLIVNTDHGFLLGEHDWWAKCVQPFYNEVAHTPLFIWDPRSGRSGERRQSLVQTIDLAPTLLDFFGADIPKDMQGKPLRETVHDDTPVREAALFGIHGGHINCTDGRYVYMRGPASPDNGPLYNYTLMPTHMRARFHPEELSDLELAEPFAFTKGVKTLRIPGTGAHGPTMLDTMLFDLKTDPQQLRALQDEAVEHTMTERMVRLMKESDAPAEQYERMGLNSWKSGAEGMEP
jgi:arylsulfatase A-like enzyme